MDISCFCNVLCLDCRGRKDVDRGGRNVVFNLGTGILRFLHNVLSFQILRSHDRIVCVHGSSCKDWSSYVIGRTGQHLTYCIGSTPNPNTLQFDVLC